MEDNTNDVMEFNDPEEDINDMTRGNMVRYPTDSNPMRLNYRSDRFLTERRVLPPILRDTGYYAFFSEQNIRYISEQVTQRLEGVHPDHKHIIVPADKIIWVMDSMFRSNVLDVDKLTMMTISYIVDHIKSEYQMEETNNKLNIWVTQYTTDTGMQRIPQIKLRDKRPNPFSYQRY